MVRKFLATAACALGLVALAPTALADNVDCDRTSPAALKAQAAIEKNPPSWSSLRAPELPMLKIIGKMSASGPSCEAPGTRTTFFYSTSLSLAEMYTALFPYIRPGIDWGSPVNSDLHDFRLTSGATVRIFCVNDDCKKFQPNDPNAIKYIQISKPHPTNEKPLTANPKGPGWNWTVEDLAASRTQPAAGRGTSYEGGGSGPVAATSTMPTPASVPASAPAPVPAAKPGCATGSNATAGNVGAEVGGAVLGGGYGRDVGRTLGGLLGGGKKKPEC